MEKKLQRDEQNKILAGVCSGLADYLEVDVTWVRIAFVVTFFAGFTGFIAYLILWIAVPAKPFIPFDSGFKPYNADYRVYEDKSFSSEVPPSSKQYEPFQPYVKPKSEGNGKLTVGIILIAFGGFFLLKEFHWLPFWFDFGKLWPLIFIIPGLIMISKAGKKEQWKGQNGKKDQEFTNNSAAEAQTNNDQPSV